MHATQTPPPCQAKEHIHVAHTHSQGLLWVASNIPKYIHKRWLCSTDQATAHNPVATLHAMQRGGGVTGHPLSRPPLGWCRNQGGHQAPVAARVLQHISCTCTNTLQSEPRIMAVTAASMKHAGCSHNPDSTCMLCIGMHAQSTCPQSSLLWVADCMMDPLRLPSRCAC